MKQIIEGLLYNTEEATVICSNRYWDGSNWDRKGRNSYLYKTKKGNFFILHTTRWQGEMDSIIPISKQDAMEIYEQLPEIEVEYKEAFGVEPEKA